LGSLVVAGESPPRIFVLDQAQRLLALSVDGTPAQDRQMLAGAEPGLLFVRDADVLWVGRDRSLHSLAAGGASPPLAMRGAAQWRHPVAIAAYAGNLYVLDPGAADGRGQIWRSVGTPGGFDGDPQPWLQANSGADLSAARGFAIDGAIWVACGEAGLVRLVAGRPEPFQPSGLDPPIASAGAVYTEFGYHSLYVVDAALRRLVQLAKDGHFERQIMDVFPKGEQPVGLWVDEAGGRALILTESRLQAVQFPQ
jgi:hypothetical protein